ncbi:MAG TPA: DUF3631 domain-containing protein [Verrucomicrobiae bacterium]|nr:DUF3631 domain-containing protein [Verrucomicrobiae bacterium]
MSPDAVPPGRSENRSPAPETTAEPQTGYPEPSPDLIADIRKQLDGITQEERDRFHQSLSYESIDIAARLLYRAGVCLCSRELYEYRKTLFPPNALLDPMTAGAPVLRARSADNSPASVPATDDEHSAKVNESSIHSSNHPTTHESILPISPTIPNAAGNTQAANVPDASIQDPGSSISPACPSDHGPLTTDNGLLSDLRSTLFRYVVLPEMAAEALALWIVHTYAFTLRQVTTYIGVVSPEKRCGKTTLLELLGLLANRSLTASNISPSALFRVIEETQPTLLIDEADTFLQGRDELAGILNAGYRKSNSYVVRVAPNKPHGRTSYTSPHSDITPEFAQWTPDLRGDPSIHPSIHSATHPSIPANSGATDFARYSCWCPKVMAAIGRLPDTLADRCIVITMQRKMPAEKCERVRQLNAVDLRKRCADFVRENSEKIAKARPDIPSTLNDRAADIWEPLFAIADLAGGEWPQLARDAAQKLSASDDDLTLIAYFLKDLRNLMLIKNADRMLSRGIISALNPLHDRPWEDLRRGREINEWWLGWQLRQLGIRTRTMRAADAMGKGYMLSDIEAAFRRYVPNAELHLAQPTVAEHLSGDLSLPKAEEAKIEAQFDRMLKQLLASLPKEP